MDNQSLVVLGFFVAINLVSFFIMLVDKVKSKHSGAERISEGMMFFMATVFGSVGVYVGMFTFHHKTQKWYFIIGIPLLMAQNCALLYCVYLLLKSGGGALG